MKLKNPLLTKMGGFLGATVIRNWTATLDYRIVYQDPTVDPVHPHCRRRYLYLLWHEYIFFPLGQRGRGMTALISQHRDGELIGRILQHLAFKVVRGSTTRGGVAALRRLRRQSFNHLAITPDGPQGPRRRLSDGPIYLASKLGLPLVCMGYGFDRPWRLNSWDRFAIPRPFTRARAVIGPAVEIPHQLDRDGIEHHRLQVEQLMNQLTREAETWAEAGTRKKGEMPLLRQKPAPEMFRN